MKVQMMNEIPPFHSLRVTHHEMKLITKLLRLGRPKCKIRKPERYRDSSEEDI